MKYFILFVLLFILSSCVTFQKKEDYKYKTSVLQMTRLNADADKEKIDQFLNEELTYFQRKNIKFAINGYFIFFIYPEKKCLTNE